MIACSGYECAYVTVGTAQLCFAFVVVYVFGVLAGMALQDWLDRR